MDVWDKSIFDNNSDSYPEFSEIFTKFWLFRKFYIFEEIFYVSILAIIFSRNLQF